MNLLGAKFYDPSTAVSKSTASLLAMTAFDTTNLRVAVTIPSHGMIYVRIMGGAISGATTVPTILIGVLNGSTVLARITPHYFPGTMNIATQSCSIDADFVITGLTPGAMNLDLAYGVEVVVASTAIKYGGPNNTTTNDAWGGISFQVWDPQPIPTAAPGAAGGLFIAGTNAATTITTGLTTTFTGNLTGSVGSVTGLTASNLDTTVSSRMATYTQPTGFLAATFPTGTVANTTNITAGTITTATNLTNLPSIPANWLTAAGIAASALNGKGDWNIGKTGYSLTSQNWAVAGDAMTLTVAYDAAKTALAASAYTAPDNTSITAIKTKTDNLNFTVAGKIDAHVQYVNGIQVTGSGTAASPWGPV